MQQQTLSVNKEVQVKVLHVPGDLRIAGWDRLEIMAKTDGDDLVMTQKNGNVLVECDEDLILYVPQAAILEIEKVSGDVSVQALQGPLSLGPVSGDLTMHDVGALNLDNITGDASLRKAGAVTARTISGDFSLRGGNGPCAIESIGGDASLRDVNGDVAIQEIGSDLFLRNPRGNVSVQADADVALYIEPQPGKIYTATAGDDILVRLPPRVDLHLHLVGTDPENINVNIPDVELSGEETEYDLILGEEGADRPRMDLTAGDDLLVTTQSEAWDSAADFGVEMNDFGSWGVPPLPPLPPDFSDRINRRVQAAMDRAHARIEAAGRHVEHGGRRMEAAVKRAEAKARAAEIRARRGQVNMNIGRWEWDLTPHGADAPTDVPSDEERLTILRMLQEKKISLEDAEKLLAALEGK